MSRASVWSASTVVVLLALVAPGCSDDEGVATDQVTGTVPSSSDESTVVTTTSAGPAPSSVVTTDAQSATTIEVIPTVPERGVPGIDSDDLFCRAWSEFAGSFQVLTFASVAESDPVAAARLELVASATVTSAAQTLADEFPESVASEREVFLDDVIGPFARRAARASDELRAAGLAAGDIEQLGDVWLAALVDAGVDDPEIVVVAPDGLTDAVDAATEVFAANVPVIAADPGLVTEAQAPATLGYLADNCPDQGILAGNDAID